jgi:hypothetical protein
MSVNDVVVRQDGSRHLGTDGTSGWVWVAARKLEERLLVDYAGRTGGLSGLRILELGSGTGWLSLRLAVRGATMTSSDQQGVLPGLVQNVLRNQEKFLDLADVSLEVDVHALHWDTSDRIQGEWDLIIGSDIQYLKECYLPLLETCIRHDCKRCIFSWEERKPEEENQFIVLAKELGFELDYLVNVGQNSATLRPVWVGSWVFASRERPIE